MRRAKKLLAGLLTALGVWGAVEVVLAGVGDADLLQVDPLPVHPPQQELCPATGGLRLCVDPVEGDARRRTTVFPETTDVPRVVVIGESFVHGFTLPVEASWPSQLGRQLPNVEVLNFGFCGAYAGRLRSLLRAALGLSPDVVVLSIGNNEHTMTSFYTGWASRHPAEVYRLTRWLGRSRVFGLLWHNLGDLEVRESYEPAPGGQGDPIDQAVFAARRRPPDLSVFPDRLASRAVTERIEAEQRLKEEVFAGHLDAMVREAQTAGAKVVLTTLPRNLDSQPTLSGTSGDDESVLHALFARLDLGEDVVETGLSVDGRVARFHYLRGKQLLEKGARKAALAHLRTANEWDLVTDATPSLNAIIRETAARHDVALVDLDSWSDGHIEAPHAWFLDVVHPSARGARAIAVEVAPSIEHALQSEGSR